MTDDVLDRAQQALNGVTDGPWVASGTWLCGEVDACTCDGPSEYHGHRRECGLEPLANIGNESVARFIAVSRPLLSELAAMLRAARTENERLRGELAATKGLLESTRQGHSATIRDFCTLRDALPREQVEQLLEGTQR